jgi:hypothetical protein
MSIIYPDLRLDYKVATLPLKKLSTLCVVEVELADQTSCLTIPEPSADIAKLIELAGVRLPTVFRSRGVKVATRRKLPENRSSR